MDTIPYVVCATSLSIGFTKAKICARSLWYVGNMAILNAKMEPETIHLVGMWTSDTILRYLHTKAKSSRMLWLSRCSITATMRSSLPITL